MGEAKRRQAQDPNWGKPQVPVIRSYRHSDFEEVVKIFDETNSIVHNFLPNEVLENQRKDVIKTLNDQNTWVAEIKGKIVGFISMITEKAIAGLYVSERFRGKGIGTKLIENLKFLKESLELAVYEKNSRAYSFYKQRCGFAVIKEGMDNDFKYFAMGWEKN